MSYLDRLKQKISETCYQEEPTKPTQPGSVSSVGTLGVHVQQNCTPLPHRVAAGLRRLQTFEGPKLKQPEVWASVVADALWLAQSGHAATALALGWSEIELFGWAPAPWPTIDTDYHGLATHLEGRRTLILETESAWVGEVPYRSCIRRNLMTVNHFLWEPVR